MEQINPLSSPIFCSVSGLVFPMIGVKNKTVLILSGIFGKPPELAIEIVSNTVGNELGKKLQNYARAGVGYYVVFDPLQCLGETILQLYELQVNRYILREDYWLEQIELGLTLWQGNFEGKEYDRWLRWCDRDGNLLLTGDERADRLARALREQGIDPETIL